MVLGKGQQAHDDQSRQDTRGYEILHHDRRSPELAQHVAGDHPVKEYHSTRQQPMNIPIAWRMRIARSGPNRFWLSRAGARFFVEGIKFPVQGQSFG
jgi:hypothetical protein